MEFPKDVLIRGLKPIKHYTENWSLFTAEAFLNVTLPSEEAEKILKIVI